MTRKDYKLIASVFAQYPLTQEKASLAEALAVVLENDNPRFNRKKFFAACQAER